MKLKQCSKCNKSKPLDSYCKDSSRKGGYEYICKQCKSIKSKTYSTNNKAKLQKKYQEYYQDNKDIILKRSRDYYHNNIEQQLLRSKTYRENNKEKEHQRKILQKARNPELYKEQINKASKKYRKSHPEYVREYSRKRRARKSALQENYTKSDEQYTMALFNHSCANCGSTENLCIDHHYPLSKGHALTRKNAVVLCNTCNASKGNKLPEEFYDIQTLTIIKEHLNPHPTTAG